MRRGSCSAAAISAEVYLLAAHYQHKPLTRVPDALRLRRTPPPRGQTSPLPKSIRRPPLQAVLDAALATLGAPPPVGPSAEAAGDVLLGLLALRIAGGSLAPGFVEAVRRTGDPQILREAADAGLGGLCARAATAATQIAAGDLRPCLAALEPLIGPACAGDAGDRSGNVPAWLVLGLLHETLVEARAHDPRTDKVSSRRRWGSHYTPLPLATGVVEEALARLGPARAAVATVCDPAMGGGVFLVAAGLAIAKQTGQPFAAVVPQLHGIDRDARAADVARFALHVVAGSPDRSVDDLGQRLVVGDALLPAPAGLVWEHTFRDVFAAGRARPGFDAIVGNPPFVGGKRIATHLGPAYARALRTVHPDASGNTDLSAHFFRRAFDRLAEGGVIAFITTSGIAKGDTREGGLAVLVGRGATIVSADRARPWPGDAAVRISTVCLVRDAAPPGPRVLDGREVSAISAFLEVGETSAPPARRPENRGIAFVGCYLRGMGFTFDDRSPRAMPLALRETLLADDPTLAPRLPAYVGGDEIARHPEQRPHRFVLDLNDLSLADEARHPRLFALARRYVKPERDMLGDTPIDRSHRERFHCWANARPELRKATAHLPRVLVTPRVSTRRFFAFLPAGIIPSEQLVVFALPTFASFAVLQSVLHDVWARTFGSSMGLGIRYTPSDVFETFPLPPGFRDDPALEDAGQELYEARREVASALGLGLGELYATLGKHPPLVALHRRADEAVARAYGFPIDAIEGVERGVETSVAARALVSRLRAHLP